ncbi:hypothetical protein [Diaphorobacter caeni]|uniref:hypothetical protein n=1 Tax=Diaphorobacter caeni TaxID=2784387 RepID=UPI00188F0607|nr:hypothetical protein [Diaphorobacter caeni]MBF5006850.1 hypothetical protein [Diaphorobacter caeni]
MPIDPNAVQWDEPAAAGTTSTSEPANAPASKIDPGAVKWDDEPGSTSPTPAAALAAKPSLGDQAARGFGIGTRGVVQGLVDLPAMVSDNLIAKPLNAAADFVAGKGIGPRLKMAGDSVGDLMTRAGVPVAQSASERVVEGINRGAAGAASTMGLGAAAATSAAAPVARAVGAELMAAPAMQLGSGAASGAASNIVRESGGGEGAQLAAGLVGGLAPSVGSFAAKAAVRGVVRGGEAGRQRMVENIKTFEDATGTTPTLGQATQSRGIQAAETGLSNVPGGAGIMQRRGEMQAKALQDSVQEVTDSLSPNATGWGAGEAIAKGVNAFKDNVKTTQTALYRKLDDFIPASTQVASTRTQQALADLNADIAGAPALSAWFKNARIQGIEGGLKSDTGGIEAILSRPGMREKAEELRARLTAEAQSAEAANQRHAGNLRLQTDEAIEANKAWRQGLHDQAASAKAQNAEWRADLQRQAEAATARNSERANLGMNNFEPVQTPKEIKELPDKYPVMSAKEINALPEPNSVMSPRDLGSIRSPNVVRNSDQIEREVADFLRGEVDGKLPYESLKKLRTLVGAEISEGGLTADVPRSKWRALYAALSDDLGDAAKAAGPQAEQAWGRANQYTRASIQRLEQLESVVNRDAPEKIFRAATSGMSDGGTQITRIMKSMPVENRREVAAAVLQRLGRARNSAQNEMGENFSSETFLTNLAAMSGPARMALFANSGMPGLRGKIEQMGRMASLRREGAQVLANPSGTARQASAIGYWSGLATALATGNVPVLTGLGAAGVGARIGAAVVNSPKTVNFFARSSELSKGAPAAAINTLSQSSNTEPVIYTNRIKAGVEARKQGRQVFPSGSGWVVR